MSPVLRQKTGGFAAGMYETDDMAHKYKKAERKPVVKMAVKKTEQFYTFSKKEAEVMEIFWETGEPLSRAEILERASSRNCTWKPNSVHILLNSLLDKGALQVEGYYLSSRKLGRTFGPAVTRQEYALMQVLHASQLAERAGVPLEQQIESLKNRTAPKKTARSRIKEK